MTDIKTKGQLEAEYIFLNRVNSLKAELWSVTAERDNYKRNCEYYERKLREIKILLPTNMPEEPREF